MRIRILAVTVGVLVVASAALAGDPWKEKKPAEWKQGDVDKILRDSPWAREYDLMTNRPDVGPSELNNASNSLTDLSQSAGGGGGRRGRNGSNGDSQQQPRAITYYAQWYSSRTIRAAQARSTELAGSPLPADSPILKVPQNYQVMVHGGDLRPFDKLGDDALKKSSYLELKSTHQKLSPEKIVILQSKAGRPIAIVFEFAKKTAAGEPTVPTSEKSVEFVSAAKDISVHFRFEVGKMADSQGSDL